MQNRYIQIDGINTRYWSVGEQGEFVILVHGLGACAEYWQYNIEQLGKHYRVYALDLMGFGASDKPAINYTLPLLATFLKKFLDHFQIKQANLVGHSMGGGVSLQFAFQFPERIKKLVLVSSIGFSKTLPLFFRLLNIPLLGEYLIKPNRKHLQELLTMHVYHPDCITSDFVDCVHEYSVNGANRSVLNFVRGNSTLISAKKEVLAIFEEGLAQLKTPTFILWGKQDNLIPLEQAYLAQQYLPHANLHVFDQCRHIPQMEHAEEFNHLVTDFLQS